MSEKDPQGEWVAKCGGSLLAKGFSRRLFALLAARQSALERGRVEIVLSESFAALSSQIESTGLQSASAVRGCLRVRSLVNLLIDDRGELQLERLERAIAFLGSHLYSLGPGRHLDQLASRHLLIGMMRLRDDARLQKLVRSASVVQLGGLQRHLIRASLGLEESGPVGTAELRRALLAAWWSYLRQSVGSCFATAPAIVIQQEQPRRLLEDLLELLSTGQLRRTIAGTEYAIPLGGSWGLGDLKSPISMIGLPERLARAPGLLRAFGVAGLLDVAAPLQAQQEELRNWLARVLSEKFLSCESGITDCDALLRAALLLKLDLTVDDVKADQMSKSVVAAAPGTRAHRLSEYRHRLSKGRNAFTALSESPLLKAWEFCLASLCDLRADINRGNLYRSLGMRHDEPHGVGRVAYAAIQERLDVLNRDLELLDMSFERAQGALEIAARRLGGALDEREMQWQRMEYSRRQNEAKQIDIERFDIQRRAELLGHLFVRITNSYLELLPSYFQEVYDPELRDVRVGPFDDAPAGFRLVYKHGRVNPTTWTYIDSAQEFVDCLVDFFVITEPQIVQEEAFNPIRRELSAIVSAIVTELRNPLFLKAALQRMGQLHRSQPAADPMGASDFVEAKPWSYISGGSMALLVGHYYGRQEEPTQTGRWVSSATDLLVMLLEQLKELPPRIAKPYWSDPMRSMLMQSPTHAFVARPGLPPFVEGWKDEGNTYTWVRDHLVLPQQQCLRRIELDRDRKEWITTALGERLPYSLRPLFAKIAKEVSMRSQSVLELRCEVLEVAQHQLGSMVERIHLPEELDSLLFESLPLTPLFGVRQGVVDIFSQLLDPEQQEAIMALFDTHFPRVLGRGFLSALQLQELCQAIWMLSTGKAVVPQDIAYAVRHAMRKEELALPAPLLFADTNWNDRLFAFGVNPGTGELDLWRTDLIGMQGVPMADWRCWWNGERREEWLLFSEPSEYGQ